MNSVVMSDCVTLGVHHVGLTVSDLEASSRFFTSTLGWQQAGGNPDYPAVFVSDGTVMLTLWQTKNSAVVAFNKDKNVGLHHLALRVASIDVLNALHKKLVESGIKIEFAPELLREGPTQHMMCYEPSGNRIEFIAAL